MSKYKYLVLTDLDGTLLNSEGCLSKETIDYVSSLKSRKDIIFSFSTGRDWKDSVDIYKQLGLDCFVSCNNGSYIYNPTTGLSNCTYLSNELVKLVLSNDEFFEGLISGEIIFNSDYHVLNSGNRLSLLDSIEKNNSGVICIKCYFDRGKSAVKDEESFNRKLMIVKSFGFDLSTTVYTQGGTLDFEIHSGLASKDKAAELLGSFYGVSSENVLTFGDQINDLSAAIGKTRFVAVKNAVDIVKQKAKIVSKYTNDENCVIREIEEFLRERN